MGLLAAQQLGFENVRIQAPNSHQLLQVGGSYTIAAMLTTAHCTLCKYVHVCTMLGQRWCCSVNILM